MEILRAARHPVRSHDQTYIRVGTYKKKLRDFPDKERELWRIFDQTPFEDGVAAERLTGDDVLHQLDYPTYFELLGRPLPSDRTGILEALMEDRSIRSNDVGGWDVTNLGAILFANRLNNFRSVERKTVRVIQYSGHGRTNALREQEQTQGYASGFEALVRYINGLLPANELIGEALRQNPKVFPELAVRELIANALIHQDLVLTGTGPMIEIFDDRIEITNPGEPLVDTRRFVDSPPRSRNEALASLMRRFGVCEERGSGIDMVVSQVELFQLPAPLFESPDGSTRAVLFAYKPLSSMDRDERVRACYLHSCLRYVMRQNMTNSSLRERFGIEPQNRSTVSRLLKEAVKAGVIAPAEADAPPKLRRYVPYWASVGS